MVSGGTLGIVSTVQAILERKRNSRCVFKEWEGTIQEIMDECNQEQKGADRILMAWRVKLEKEPTLLQPYQIDEIVREVRQRLNNPSR